MGVPMCGGRGVGDCRVEIYVILLLCIWNTPGYIKMFNCRVARGVGHIRGEGVGGNVGVVFIFQIY